MTLTLAPNGDLMTHWSTRDFSTPPNKEKALILIKNLTEFYNNIGRKYLYDGKMSKVNSFECEEIEIPMLRGKPVAKLPRLLCSSWKAENDKVAYIVVNPEDCELCFTISKDRYNIAPLSARLIIK
jgi:hypothetical protein